MTNPSEFLMQDGCPWVDLRKLTGVPNVRWCEDQLCAWVTNPANTWSNLPYIFVGFFFFWLTRKEKAENIRFYGVAAQWVGWSSFIYHASLTFGTQVLDFFGMFIFFYLLLVQNFARMGTIKGESVKKVVWIATVISTAASAISDKFGFPLQGLILVLIVAILVTEVLASRKSVKPIRYKALGWALFFLAIGAAFSASDVTRKFCTPDNHWIQGHALWHCFNSISLLLTIYHYRQFYSRETGKLDV
jgi:hypothetical protein